MVDPATCLNSTINNTLPSNFEGLIVPNSGNPTNGLVYAKSFLTGGYNQGVRVAPRFGFAWAPLKNTVVRGGFGISYDRARTDQDNNEAQSPPNVLTPVLYYGSLTNINSAAANGARGTIGLTAVSPADHTPSSTATTWGFSETWAGDRRRHSVRRLVGSQSGAGDQSEFRSLRSYIPGQFTGSRRSTPTAWFRPCSQVFSPHTSNAGLAFNGVNALPQDFLRP